MYIREARVTDIAKIPGIPKVLEVGRLTGGTVFTVREEIKGFSVLELLNQRGKLSAPEVMALLKSVALILNQLHEWRGHRIFHSDIKPGNIILGDDGTTTLIDFGAARTVEMGSTYRQSQSIHGTPDYMPIEQLAGGADPSSDLYSLGVTAIEALLGYIPPSLKESQIDRRPYHLPDDSETPVALMAILEKMVHPLKGERYRSAETLLNDLSVMERINSPSTTSLRPHSFQQERIKILNTLTELWGSGGKSWLQILVTLGLIPCQNTFGPKFPFSRRGTELKLMKEFGERICDAFLNPSGGPRLLETDTFLSLLTIIIKNSDFFYQTPRLFSRNNRNRSPYAFFWHLYLRGMSEQNAALSTFGSFGWYSDPKAIKSPIQELVELTSLMATRLDSKSASSFEDALRRHPKDIFYDRRASLMLLCAILRGEQAVGRCVS